LATRILAECGADQSCNGKHNKSRQWVRSVHAAVCICPCLTRWESLKGGKKQDCFSTKISRKDIYLQSPQELGLRIRLNNFIFFRQGWSKGKTKQGFPFGNPSRCTTRWRGGGTLTKLYCTPLSHRRIIHLRRPRDAPAGPSPPEGLRGGCRRPGFAWVSLSAPPRTGGGGGPARLPLPEQLKDCI